MPPPLARLNHRHRPPAPSAAGMTGGLVVRGVGAAHYKSFAIDDSAWPPRFWKVELRLGDGTELAFCDSRRFARVRLLAGACCVRVLWVCASRCALRVRCSGCVQRAKDAGWVYAGGWVWGCGCADGWARAVSEGSHLLLLARYAPGSWCACSSKAAHARRYLRKGPSSPPSHAPAAPARCTLRRPRGAAAAERAGVGPPAALALGRGVCSGAGQAAASDKGPAAGPGRMGVGGGQERMVGRLGSRRCCWIRCGQEGFREGEVEK